MQNFYWADVRIWCSRERERIVSAHEISDMDIDHRNAVADADVFYNPAARSTALIIWVNRARKGIRRKFSKKFESPNFPFGPVYICISASISTHTCHLSEIVTITIRPRLLRTATLNWHNSPQDSRAHMQKCGGVSGKRGRTCNSGEMGWLPGCLYYLVWRLHFGWCFSIR